VFDYNGQEKMLQATKRCCKRGCVVRPSLGWKHLARDGYGSKLDFKQKLPKRTCILAKLGLDSGYLRKAETVEAEAFSVNRDLLPAATQRSQPRPDR